MLLTLGIIVLVVLVVFAIRRANAVDESCCAVPPKVTPPATASAPKKVAKTVRKTTKKAVK